MKLIKLIILFTLAFSLKGFTQNILPVSYRVEKQSMSIPMSLLEDAWFADSYYTKPITVKFDGELLYMFYDNDRTFIKEGLTKIDYEAEYEEDFIIYETSYYTMNSNPSDTIMFVVDHEVPYIQLVLPTKNSKGVNVGYTSYKKYISQDEYALN